MTVKKPARLSAKSATKTIAEDGAGGTAVFSMAFARHFRIDSLAALARMCA